MQFTILKEWKAVMRKSMQMLKKHYFILAFLSLVVIFFGREFHYAAGGLSLLNDQEKIEAAADGPGNIFSAGDVFTMDEIREGSVADAAQTLFDRAFGIDRKKMPLTEEAGDIAAQVADDLLADTVFFKLGQTVYQTFHAKSVLQGFLIIASFLWYALVLIFVSNVLYAAFCRIFLEARVYEKIQFHDFLYMAPPKRWFSLSAAMFVQYVLTTLWGFTIIGGLIKDQSYFCVPYIAAEHPEMKPLETITLSRKMMNGHKMECFLMKISMAGFFLLDAVTFGFSELFLGVPFRIAAYAEFYARIREKAIENGVEGTEALDDRFLFEKADKIELYEVYFDVVDEITLIYEGRVRLEKVRNFFARNFGIWLGTLAEKRRYDDLEGRKFAIERDRQCMNGLSYPLRLNPRYEAKAGEEKKTFFTFMRSYSVWTLFLLFIMFSVLGWTWEVALHFVQTGEFANRGTLLGPWLPIYGSGGVVVLMLCSRVRSRPVLQFFTAIGLCGVLEYTAAWVLETRYHVRWWSYDGYFLNLHGRICAQGLLVFGVACCLVIYLIAPVIDFLLSRIRPQILIGCSVVLAALFFADALHSGAHPNMSVGAIEEEPPAS